MEICKGKNGNGHCLNTAMKGKEYCNSCNILRDTSTKTGRTRAYKLMMWQERLEELSDPESLKSLTEEVGILKITLEQIINTCHTSNDFLQHSFKISDLAVKIDKLVTSCHKLDKAHGQLLDKASVLQIAGTIIKIIGNYVTDPEMIEKIANDIIDVIANTAPDSEDE